MSRMHGKYKEVHEWIFGVIAPRGAAGRVQGPGIGKQAKSCKIIFRIMIQIASTLPIMPYFRLDRRLFRPIALPPDGAGWAGPVIYRIHREWADNFFFLFSSIIKITFTNQ